MCIRVLPRVPRRCQSQALGVGARRSRQGERLGRRLRWKHAERHIAAWTHAGRRLLACSSRAMLAHSGRSMEEVGSFRLRSHEPETWRLLSNLLRAMCAMVEQQIDPRQHAWLSPRSENSATKRCGELPSDLRLSIGVARSSFAFVPSLAPPWIWRQILLSASFAVGPRADLAMPGGSADLPPQLSRGAARYRRLLGMGSLPSASGFTPLSCLRAAPLVCQFVGAPCALLMLYGRASVVPRERRRGSRHT